jgi:transcriptional regulator with XRE-family HTH domain
MTSADFKRWMQAYGLSLSTAADLLGLSRRAVAYYASGERSIPRVVFLACMALLADARRKTRTAA